MTSPLFMSALLAGLSSITSETRAPSDSLRPKFLASSGVTFWITTPSHPRTTFPLAFSCGTRLFAILTGIANPTPWPPEMIAVLMPTTSPRRLKSGPPLFPGLIRHSRLDEVIVRPLPYDASFCAHYARSHRMIEAVWVAYGDHPVAHFELVGIAERGHGQAVLGAHLDECDVRFRVLPYDLRVVLLAVRKVDLYAGRLFYYMIIGKDIAGPVDDDAGAEAFLLKLPPWAVVSAEKLLENLIVAEKSLKAFPNGLGPAMPFTTVVVLMFTTLGFVSFTSPESVGRPFSNVIGFGAGGLRRLRRTCLRDSRFPLHVE